MKKMKFKSKIIKIISAGLLMLIVFSIVPVVSLYAADETNENSGKDEISFSSQGVSNDLSFSIENLFRRVSGFKGKNSNSALTNSFTEIITQFSDVVSAIGRYIMYALILFFGVRTIWEGVEGKAQFKELLPYLLVGVVFFWAAPGIVELFIGFLDVNFSGSAESNMSQIFAAVVSIARVLAFAGIIFTGIKLMFSGADKKADAKSSLIPVLIGSIIVFTAATVVGLVMNVAKETGINVNETIGNIREK